MVPACHRYVNFSSLVRAVEPLLGTAGRAAAQGILAGYHARSRESLRAMWCDKLGLPRKTSNDTVDHLVDALFTCMERHNVDFTIFFRNLPRVLEAATEKTAESTAPNETSLPGEVSNGKLLEALGPFRNTAKFCAEVNSRADKETVDFLRKWLAVVLLVAPSAGNESVKSDEGSGAAPRVTFVAEACRRMRSTSPKYIPREEMLVEVYEAANKDDFAPFHELHSVLLRPFDEFPELEVRSRNTHFSKTCCAHPLILVFCAHVHHVVCCFRMLCMSAPVTIVKILPACRSIWSWVLHHQLIQLSASSRTMFKRTLPSRALIVFDIFPSMVLQELHDLHALSKYRFVPCEHEVCLDSCCSYSFMKNHFLAFC